MTVRDDRLTGLEAALDDRFRRVGSPDRHGTEIDGLLPVDDEHERTLLTCLHRDRRHHDRVRVRRQRHDDVDVLTGPEPVIGVRKGPFHSDRARRLIDRVVDERDASDRGRRHIVRRIRGDPQRAGCHVLLQFGQTGFRDRERDRDRRHLVDHDQRRLVVGADQVTLVHHQRARAPRDRRGDRRVLELHLRILQRRLVGIHGCVERGCRRLRGIDLLAWRDASLREFLEPLGLLRGVGGLREIAVEVGLRLLHRRFEGALVEREQDLPGLDVVSFGEVDAGQLASRLSANRHAREGSAAPMTLISIGIDFRTTVPTATGTAGAPPRPPLPSPGPPDAAAPSSPAQPATMSWTSKNRMMAGVRMRPMSPSRYSMILVEPRASWTGRCSTMEGRNGYSINAGPGAGDWPARAEAMA